MMIPDRAVVASEFRYIIKYSEAIHIPPEASISGNGKDSVWLKQGSTISFGGGFDVFWWCYPEFQMMAMLLQVQYKLLILRISVLEWYENLQCINILLLVKLHASGFYVPSAFAVRSNRISCSSGNWQILRILSLNWQTICYFPFIDDTNCSSSSIYFF